MPPKRSAQRPTFLIVEADVGLAKNLGRVVQTFGPVRSCSKFRSALTLFKQVEHLLAVIVGHALPDGDGLDLVERLRGIDDVVPVLVISDSYEHDVINRTQLFGAQYLRRPPATENVVAFVRRAIEQRGGPDNVLAMLLFDLAEAQRLSDRERELVTLVARGESVADLADSMGVSANTVKTLTRRVLRKCGAPNLDSVVRPLRRVALGVPERIDQDS